MNDSVEIGQMTSMRNWTYAVIAFSLVLFTVHMTTDIRWQYDKFHVALTTVTKNAKDGSSSTQVNPNTNSAAEHFNPAQPNLHSIVNNTNYNPANMTKQLFPYLPGLISMDEALQLPPPVPVRPNSKEPLLAYSQQRDYPVLLANDNVCQSIEKPPFLLMVVKSACALSSRREAVRQTWADEKWAKQDLNVVIRHVFLLGACRDPKLTEHVRVESETHRDILQWDFFDSFRNLTLKEVLFLQWFARRCRNVPFVFKGDDDVFVNTRNVIEYIRQLPSPNTLFVGSLLKGSPRILDPSWKYFVSYNLYPDKFYPPYVSGGGFLMSGGIAVKLFKASLHERIFPIDDAFLGTLLKRIGVMPGNDRRFKSWGMKQQVDECRLAKVFTYHKADPSFLRTMWHKLNNLDPSKCDSNYDVFRSSMNR